MERERSEDLETRTVDVSIVYDRTSGEVMVTHEVLAEVGCSAPPEEAEAFALEMAAQDFGDRPKGTLRVDPKDSGADQPFRVDPQTGRLVAAPKPGATFRDYIAKRSEPYP